MKQVRFGDVKVNAMFQEMDYGWVCIKVNENTVFVPERGAAFPFNDSEDDLVLLMNKAEVKIAAATMGVR